ncbi:MAG: tetratricopeptide repeat protein [Deltaproteobacteria bacterium]|nr:tetratricopeptide repeat protein [Deltaproteobacteria bacterium]
MPDPDRASSPPGAETTADAQTSVVGDSTTSPDHDDTARANGERIGRFIVLGMLGRGGMGTVYRAYDPVLDRAIAVKVLHRGGDPQRLLREAQALARLHHANVLTIHEAAIDHGQPYLATELVEGSDLAHWLREPREPAEILAVFAAAGRGLAAAHEAGLVHRDFKPSNVLLGRDGRVRVADLGIVRGLPTPEPHGDAAAVDGPVTATGAIVGTPAYMAPEQAEGGDADARSDQFSYCVSLWEALSGRRPFDAPGPARMAAIARGPVELPGARPIPARLRRTLVRGLSLAAADRFPSMEALLAELFPRSRRRWWIALAGAGAAGAAVMLALASRTPAPTCGGFEEDLAGTWDATVRQRLATAFRGAHQPALDAEWPRTEGALDRYAQALVAERGDTCADTRVRGGQSTEVMDRRMACLDRLQLDLGAVTRLLASGDPEVLARGTSAVLALRPPTICQRADAFALRPTPADADGRARLARVEAGLAELKAMHDAARHKDGLTRVDPVVADARALGAPALVAEALYWRGMMLRQLDQYEPALAAYREAALEAESAGADRLRFDVLVKSIDLTGYFLEDRGQTAWISDEARGLLGRFGQPPDQVADLAETMANAHMRFGQLDLARKDVDQMFALRKDLYRDDDPKWAKTLRSYARVTQLQGELDITDRYMTQALAIMERHLGPDHPDLGYYLNVIGILQRQRGQLDAAEKTFRRLIASDTRAYGADNGKTGRTWNNLGGVLFDLGRMPEALDAYQHALAIHAVAVGPTSELYAGTATAIANTLLSLGRLDDAQARIREALAIYAAHPDDRDVIDADLVAAQIAVARKDPAAALALADHAVAMADGDTGTPTLGIVPRAVRGELYASAGRSIDAEKDFAQALAILDAHPQAPMQRAAIELALARVVAPRDRARAMTLASAARDRVAALSDAPAKALAASAAAFVRTLAP